MKEGEKVSQTELRELYRSRLKCEKQCYIAEQTGINADLYDYLFEKLEAYLLNN